MHVTFNSSGVVGVDTAYYSLCDKTEADIDTWMDVRTDLLTVVDSTGPTGDSVRYTCTCTQL